MRTIKFRVRNKDTVSFIDISNTHCGCGWIQDKFTTFEQFSGLLDKNGNEIYEGDILQYLNNEGEMTDKYFVEWKDRGFLGRWESKKEQDFNDCDGLDKPERDMIIIGNIYENPELLNQCA